MKFVFENFLRIATNKLLGAILLIAGTTIGAAVLALPVLTGRNGFLPAMILLIAVWGYLLYAAFCWIEVLLALPSSNNIVSMAEKTLGLFGKIISWSLYLFLLYALETAYISAISGFLDFLGSEYFGLNLSPTLYAVVAVCILFPILMRYGVFLVDYFNRIGMLGLVISYIVLLFSISPHVHLFYLQHYAINSLLLGSLSVMLTAFGFHIILPTLVTYLDRDVKKLKKAILIGTFIPLVAYLVWQFAVLGIVPQNGARSIASALEQDVNGADLVAVITDSHVVRTAVRSLSFFAILTSLIGVSISLLDFLRDGLRVGRKKVSEWKIFMLAFLPPLYFAVTCKHAFFAALSFAGAFGVVLLLGLLPLVMVWRIRYCQNIRGPYQVAGGKKTLLFFMVLSLFFVFCEIECKFY